MSAEVELQPIGSDQKLEQDTEFQPPNVPLNNHVQTQAIPNVQGLENPAFQEQEETESQGQKVLESNLSLPPMTFVDFLPLKLEDAASADDCPRYAEFSSVMEQANQWIKDNHSFMVMKCESFIKKLGGGDTLDADSVVYHESSYGVNKYVRGLRLWLAPKGETDTPPQALGYLTSLPDPAEAPTDYVSMLIPSRSEASIPSFCSLPEAFEKLNKFLKKKPLPGSVLNVETLRIKYEDTDPSCCVNTERMCWSESGRADRIFVTAIRVFYVIGKPTFETIGMHDEIPVCQNNFEVMAKLRFCPFTTVVQRARKWLQSQKGIRVINMQTIHTVCDRNRAGECQVHTDKSCYMEPQGQDLQLARVLRIYYIQDPKSEVCPYEKLQLTTRLFIPTRRGGYGKDYESFSKTMQRIITWLTVTQIPIFGVETITYPFSPDNYGSGVFADQASVSRIAAAGKYFITTVRFYFPCEFKEPPPELYPEIEEEPWGWACSVS